MNDDRPVLSPAGAAVEISRLKLLPGFPSNDAAAMLALIDFLTKWFVATKRGPRDNRQIVTPESQLREVVDHMLAHDREWKGPARMKEIYEDRYSGPLEWDKLGELPRW
jgi:hypothetical protein